MSCVISVDLTVLLEDIVGGKVPNLGNQAAETEGEKRTAGSMRHIFVADSAGLWVGNAQKIA